MLKIIHLLKILYIVNFENLTVALGLWWLDKLGYKDNFIIQTIRRSINDTSKNYEVTRNV